MASPASPPPGPARVPIKEDHLFFEDNFTVTPKEVYLFGLDINCPVSEKFIIGSFAFREPGHLIVERCPVHTARVALGLYPIKEDTRGFPPLPLTGGRHSSRMVTEPNWGPGKFL